MKKTLTALILAAVSSCTYLQRVDEEVTGLVFSEEKIRCNYAQVKITPDNDKVFYIAECITQRYFDEMVSDRGEHYIMQHMIDSSRAVYNRWRGESFRDDAKYIANLEDIMFYYAENMHTFTQLELNTDYVIIAFCVNSVKMIPMGDLQLFMFTTPGADIRPSNVTFDFMFKMVGGKYYSYVKPMEDGKICHEPYIADYAEVEDLENGFGGDLVKYIEYWMPVYKEYMGYYSKFDIARSHPGYLDGLVPGKKYKIFAFPYAKDYASHISTLTFTFQDGLYIPYSHDE